MRIQLGRVLSCACVIVSLSVPVVARPVSFNAPRLFAPSTSFSSMALGDFDRDGKPDIAITTYGSANNVEVLLTGGKTTTYPVTGASLIIGDFNGDGKPDLAVAGSVSPYNIWIMLGNGDGTFEPPIGSPAGTTPEWIAAGDFNGDGKLDLVVAGTVTAVSVLLGNGDGSFQPPISNTLPNSVISGPVVADFNSDGHLDIAVDTYLEVGNWKMAVLLGNGDGTFQLPKSTSITPEYAVLAVGEFNSDGKPDLAVALTEFDDTQTIILLGNGDGTFRQGAS